jgi:hypothetical protein
MVERVLGEGTAEVLIFLGPGFDMMDAGGRTGGSGILRKVRHDRRDGMH